MEPPGGLPPDRGDRQLVPVIQTVKPILTLNLPQQSAAPSTTATSHAAVSPAATSSSHHQQPHPHSTSPALASTATAYSATTQAATAFSGSSVGQQHVHQPHHIHHQNPATHSSQQQPPPPQQLQSQPTITSTSLPLQHHGPGGHHNSSSSAASASGSVSSSLLGGSGGGAGGGGGSSGPQQQPPIEKLSRPMAFDKMESLVREMQDPEHGVPVRQQKMFLTSIPYAFMGYDLIEWLMDRLFIEESEALNIANQLCLHGYFFPVNDTKTLTVKDDSSLYRFQTPYYWPWQHKAPDNVEYAIYLAKRSLRNKQRHALEDYEAEALTSLHKNLKGKWDFISMQAEEQVRLAKERKKGDKIVGDSQERAYWRVHRPPPGQFTPLEPCPIPSRDRLGLKPNKKKTLDDVQREVDYLKKSLNRTRMKMSQACESLVCYSETFIDYDFFLQPVLPSNPWVTEDVTFWQLNNIFVNTPTEKRVKRWAISIEELVSDPTGLQEFTSFLEKEYSHENIRFWIEVNRLRRSAHSQVVRKVNEIYEEFLKPGAPCEINIDGKTMESVLKGLRNPSRFTFDSASEHIYMLLLKKDCYPRFIRSDHYKRLLETGIQPSHKKRFFNFGGVSGAKKKIAALSSQPGDGTGVSGKAGGNSSSSGGMMQAPPPGNLARRRGSDRSLTGSAHELAVIGVNKDMGSKVPHSHSQSNLSEIPYSEAIYRGDMAQCQRVAITETGIYAVKEIRVLPMHVQQQEPPKPKTARLEPTLESSASAVCPWDVPDEPPSMQAPVPTQVHLSICPWEQDAEPEPKPTALSVQVAGKGNSQRLTSTSSDITDMSDRMQRNLGIRHQNTVDSGEAGIKRLMPNFTEQRRASMSFTPNRISEYPFGKSAKTSSTPSPGGQHTASDSAKSMEPFASAFPPLFTPLQAQRVAVALATSMGASAGVITKDPPSSSDAEIEEELNKLTISQRNSESSASEMSALPPPTPTPPPLTKITPPPPDDSGTLSGPDARNVTRESSKTESPSVAETIDEDDEAEAAEAEEVTEATDEPSLAATTGGDAEVEAEIQDVQIELIETAAGKADAFSGPPSIQVDEPPPSSPAPPKSPAPKSHPRKLISNAAIEVDEPDVEEGGTPPLDVGSNNSRSRMSTPSISLERPDSCSADAEVAAISSMGPPPVPSVGPMEEEELELRRQQELQKQKQPQSSAADGNQEELSPTTDEYQEGLQFGDHKEDYEYDIVDVGEHMGYIPPAPTPAPSLAPLAELDADDEACDELPAKSGEAQVAQAVATTSAAAAPQAAAETASGSNEELRKRRKKRNSDGKKMSSIEEKEKDKEKPVAGEADRNAVCPWEDENVTTSDGTFVKTYATLGYL